MAESSKNTVWRIVSQAPDGRRYTEFVPAKSQDDAVGMPSKIRPADARIVSINWFVKGPSE